MHFHLKKALEFLVILALLGAIVFFALRSWRTSHVNADSADAVSADVPLTVEKLSYSNPRASLSFTKAENGSWVWTEFPDYPLTQNHLNRLENDLRGFSPTLVAAGVDAETLEDYALDQPDYTLRADYSDGSVLSVQIGKATDEGSYYMRYTDEARQNDVYLMDASPVGDLNVGIYDMYTLETLPALTESNLGTLRIEEGTKENWKTYTMTNTGTEDAPLYIWYAGARNASRDPGVDKLLGALTALKLNSCIVWKPVEDSLSICGFTPSTVIVNVTYTDANEHEHTLVVNVGDMHGDTERYVTVDGLDAIYTMDAATLAPFVDLMAPKKPAA